MKSTLENAIKNSKEVKIEFNPTETTKQKIIECIERNIFYGIFPIVGDSMECEDKKKCIPDGSNVLAIDTNIKLSNGIENVWHEIPIGKTLLISGKTYTGKSFFMCKSIISVDAVTGYVLLDSYNLKHGSKWIPFDWIEKIFEVVQIV